MFLWSKVYLLLMNYFLLHNYLLDLICLQQVDYCTWLINKFAYYELELKNDIPHFTSLQSVIFQM